MTPFRSNFKTLKSLPKQKKVKIKNHPLRNLTKNLKSSHNKKMKTKIKNHQLKMTKLRLKSQRNQIKS